MLNELQIFSDFVVLMIFLS